MHNDDELTELKIAYKAISKLMKDYNKTHDTSFVHVKNFIATKICDNI